METGILLGAALTCAAGGVLPWINAEVVLLGAAAMLPATNLPVLVLLCALGQMSSKVGVYAITRWAPDALPHRARVLVGRAERYRERRRLLVGAVFLGASASVPPFYLVTLASGLLRVPLALFAMVGLLGTAVRYSFLVWAACALGAGACP
jgi:membrane protein YqaA with SNARE-associated domain